MKKSLVIDAANNFIDVVWSGKPPTDAALLAALDRLLFAYHETPQTNIEVNDKLPPRQEWQDAWNDAAKRFPDYGFYALADPLDISESPNGSMGDAIDDIADISKELRCVLWYADNVSNAAAHWHLRALYFEWGRHARELSYYLFSRVDR